MVRHALTDAIGIELNCCPDAREALAMAIRIPATVILLELGMPHFDGLALVTQFRHHELTQHTPIIVLNSDQNPQIQARAFDLGANDYLVKLPDQTELIARIFSHSKAYMNLLQRDAAYRALRESQQQLIESNATLISLNQKLEEEFSHGLAGYIVIDLPNALKKPFHDLLLGFEDYAELLGYSVTVSVDNSISNKFGFKFTVASHGDKVSGHRVQKDLAEYIEKMRKGAPLEDLPVVLRPDKHHLLILAMHNRINFLQNSHDVQRGLIQHYQILLTDITSKIPGMMSSSHQVVIQTGAGNSADSFLPVNSPQAVQGVGNRLIGNQAGQSIHIANSFNERRTQIEAVETLRNLLLEESEASTADKRGEAAKPLQKIADELKDEDHPDAAKIHRWLETAKYSLKSLGLAKEVTDAAKVLWEMFKLTFP